MKKPRVVRVKKSETVGNERAGRYWVWNGPNDNKPGISFKKASNNFSPGFTYQEYEGEIPEFPVEKTDKEKLDELIAVAEMVANLTEFHGWCTQDHIRELQALIKELKEKP